MASRFSLCAPFTARHHLLASLLRSGPHQGLATPPLLTSQATSALCVSRRSAKSRSLSPDDPFGERSSWEDPSDGVFSAWKDVDLEGFADAANSEEVRQAHFGPEWARFATVGRLSVKKMNEDRGRHGDHTSTGEKSHDHAEALDGAAAGEKRSPRHRTQAEVANEQDLRHKKKLMEKNYNSYEAYLAAEYGDGGAERVAMTAKVVVNGMEDTLPRSDARPTDSSPSSPLPPPGASSAYATAAALEATFFEKVDGHDAHDRMTQRNPHREALSTAEAAQVEEEMPLPDFMLNEATPSSSPASVAAATSPPHGDAAQVASEEVAQRLEYTDGPQNTTVTVSSAFITSALTALGERHGNLSIPLVDPIDWNTDVILHFLRIFEQRASPDVPSVMDETMCDAFEMAQVDGKLLLDIVVPPRLFRVLRRWHTRRRDAVVRAHRLTRALASQDTPTAQEAAAILMAGVAREWVPKLDEAVAPVNATLIQETILLCFPYGGGGRG